MHNHDRGFTLIELLVTLTIMLLIVGSGIAAFVMFNDRQTIQGSAKTLQTYLRGAQTKARNGERPTACDKLLNYSVRANAGSNQVNVLAVCQNGEYLQNNYQLPLSVTFQSAINMQFLVLAGGVKNSGTITLTGNNYRYALSVSPGGEISQGDFLP